MVIILIILLSARSLGLFYNTVREATTPVHAQSTGKIPKTEKCCS